MGLGWAEKSFLLGLLEKRLQEEPDCRIAKEIKEKILEESPVLKRMLYPKEHPKESDV